MPDADSTESLPPGLPALPGNWEWRALKSFVSSDRGICYGIVQPGQFTDDGIPILRVENIENGRVLTDSVYHVSAEVSARHSRSVLRGGELLVTLVGAYFGKVAVAPTTVAGFNTARAVGVVPVDADAQYLSLALRSPVVQGYLKSWATTTAQPTLNLADVAKIPIPFPPANIRDEITNVITSLERKLELNRRMNGLLEGMARAIFKAWFIDFKPVKAKAAGATSFPGMPQPVFDQLPSIFINSELGEIPEGWEVRSISDLVDIIGGGTPSTKNPDYWDGGMHPFCTPKDMSKLRSVALWNTERSVTDAGLAKISSGQLPAGTVLLSSRAPIGYLAISQIPVSVNQGIIALGCRELPPSYILLWTEANMEAIKSRAGGSTFAEISKTNFRPIPALTPDPQTLGAFGKQVEPFFKLVAKNEMESQVLAKTRDLLLPRLISGELAVGIQGGEPNHDV